MKIFITYTSAGSGHFKAAEAIYNYFQRNNLNFEIKLINVLDNSHKLFKSTYINTYAFMISYIPWLWAAGFYITYIKLLRPIIKQIHFLINRLNTMRFARFLIEENPDFIISTHFLPLEVISYLKKTNRINSRLITVITDFGVHPFWLSAGTDIYIVASEFSKQRLISEGVKEERIKVLGIPIDEKFSKRYNKDLLCAKFSLEKNKFTPLETMGGQKKEMASLTEFTVLIVTGSFGIGPIERITDLLYREVQILVVCARNKALFNRLRRRNYPHVSVFGFVDNIEELMAVSDIIITKPGGLTIAELLTMELAPIFISAIPGQETTNIEALDRYGIGLGIKDVGEIKGAVLDYKDHPDKLNKIKENMRRLKKPDVLREIYNVVCAGSAGDTG